MFIKLILFAIPFLNNLLLQRDNSQVKSLQDVCDMLCIVNVEREKEHLEPVKGNSLLDLSATNKCKDMIKQDYWAHVGPDNQQPWRFFNEAGYSYRYAGENLCRDNDDTECMRLFMLSEKHRDNIMNPKYKELGIGRCTGKIAGVETNLIVQHFGTKY